MKAVNRFIKNLEKKEVNKMKKNILWTLIALLLVITPISLCFAANPTIVQITASIPLATGGLNAEVSKIVVNDPVDPADDDWSPATTLNFGTLQFDDVDFVFRPADPAFYFAIDLGVIDNSGNPWTLTHTRTSVRNTAGTANLDDNINVSFVKQLDDVTATDLLKVSYNNSNSRVITKAQLTGGWLRIYYGLGTGNTDHPELGTIDNPGVLPITLDKPAGTYSGQVTITLASS
ncbi:MAG: hypothetical protein AB1481_04900 [Candidatus Omnitrophota bacterium]